MRNRISSLLLLVLLLGMAGGPAAVTTAVAEGSHVALSAGTRLVVFESFLEGS